MIRCKIWMKGNKVVFGMRGHAGYAEEGKDVVCAAASALSNTLAAYLLDKEEIAVKCKLEKGLAVIVAEAEKDAEVLKEIVWFVSLGLTGLATAYPKNFAFGKNF